MLFQPNIDPVAVQLGPLAIRWYGLMYLVGIGGGWILGRMRAKKPGSPVTPAQVDDLIWYLALGVLLGARVGYMLFYDFAALWQDPLRLFAVWRGGMSFHGGLLGTVLGMWWFARKHRVPFFAVTDFVCPLAPIGIFFGRIGNFINGELWGRPVGMDLPWAMVFPWVDALPRHPSQLYQAAGEGLLLFVILWLYAAKPRPLTAVSALFLVGYGVLRFIAEFFRTPDPGIFGTLSLGLSTAQWLCVPMIAVGAWMLLRLEPARPSSS